MKVQDFFSLVQLGVGIHAGTAILQLAAEFGIPPVERRFLIVERWVNEEKKVGKCVVRLEEALTDIFFDIVIFREQYFQEYRMFSKYLFGCAGILAIFLIVMSFMSDVDISWPVGVALSVVNFAPACVLYTLLSRRVSKASNPIVAKIENLENTLRRI